MLQAVRNNFKAIIFVLIFGIFGLLAVWVSIVAAQERGPNTNMRELLTSLDSRIKTEPDLGVTIKFIQPLIDVDEFFWEIPYQSEDGDFRRDFGEIGDDFICFDERAGSSFGTRCTPFSNIAAITYFNNP